MIRNWVHEPKPDALADIIDQVEHDAQTFIITKATIPAAVIMPFDEWVIMEEALKRQPQPRSRG